MVSYRCGEVAAELELLERDGHGVRAEEEDEGHQSQIRDVFTGVPHQHTSVLHTLLLTQLTPVHVRHVELRKRRRRKRGNLGIYHFCITILIIIEKRNLLSLTSMVMLSSASGAEVLKPRAEAEENNHKATNDDRKRPARYQPE